MAEICGFKVIYVSGACTSLERYGLADMGLLTATEMIENVRCITSATKLPVVADAEAGYGNVLNVVRTVREMIRAGAAAIHIEDQEIPKRCGHLRGKILISAHEMVGKIKASKKVIRDEGRNLVLIARTDARNAVGGGMEEVIRRLKLYAEAGADIVASDVLLSEDEIKAVVEAVDVPVAYHPTGLSPRIPIERLKKLGISAVVFPITPLHVAAVAVWDFYKNVLDKGTEAQINFERKVKNHRLSDLMSLFEIGRFRELIEYEKEFMSEEEIRKRYTESFGMGPE
jgi:2-methylisocitrate lyase-like PEP mutase family enzyme